MWPSNQPCSLSFLIIHCCFTCQSSLKFWSIRFKVSNYSFHLCCLSSFNNQFYSQCRALLLIISLPMRTFLVAMILIRMESSCFSHISSCLKFPSFGVYYSQRNFTWFTLFNGNPLLRHRSCILSIFSIWNQILWSSIILHLFTYKFDFTNCIKVKHKVKDCVLCF